jgi:hypothetical protein
MNTVSQDPQHAGCWLNDSLRPESGRPNDALNSLFSASWPDHVTRDFNAVLQHSLAHVFAFDADRLIGFVNVAWDGGLHAFLLDPTVDPQ